MALVGCTVHEAHLAAAAAVVAHDAVQRVTALVHVQGGSKAAPTVAALLQTLRRTRASLAVPPPAPAQAADGAAGAPPPLGPIGGRDPGDVAIPVYTAAAAAARQGQHGRDLVPSGSSLLAAVQAQAGGL